MSGKSPKLVGSFIRQRRAALGLSQRELGLLFSPSVTTQFISNIERGVTPLPPAHVATLVRALQVPEAEVLALLEREYTAKLSDRLGRSEPMSARTDATPVQLITGASPDSDFIRSIAEAFRQADPKTREAFANAASSLLNLPRQSGSGLKTGTGGNGG
jgi:transcriptional regulator with XRE-family HTH domain